jgi:multisubunit Na+/H+ antiporter MnhF subunit
MDNLKKTIKIIGEILFIFILIIILYQIFRAIIGGTWETENIIIGALGIIVSGLFVIIGFIINQSNKIGMLVERTNNIGNSLSNLGKNFKEHCKSK